ncbi:MAG: ZPR1 zinc finger domain-containing protein [Acidilobaceae archaeon]
METEEPVKLYSSREKCPVCGQEKLEVDVYTYSVPHFGRVLILVAICGNCGFSNRNVMLAEEQKPKKILVEVSGEEELRYMVVKSSKAGIKIREKNLQFTPTIYTPGLITTIEGLVYMFEEPVDIACREASGEECRELKEWLSRAVEGRERFTIVLCDFDGGSKIVGDSVVERELDEECRDVTPL